MLFLYLMLVESTENTAEKVFEKSVCESCGKEFPCGAKVGECWCFAVEVKTKVTTDLREKFENCLCSDCLKLLNSV